MILVDAHVHIYDCFDLKKFFEAAYENFKSEAGRLGYGDDFVAILLLAETSKENWFNRLAYYSGDKKGSGGKTIGNWTFHRTSENHSLMVRSNPDRILFLISGRQIVSAENLEVLALATKSMFKDGTPIEDLIDEVNGCNGIPVIPWGFGKWMGCRGNILNNLIESAEGSNILLGDNGGRSLLFPTPYQFKLAEKKKIKILPGSDPLPLAFECQRVGSFGLSLNRVISEEHPAKDLKRTLMDPTIQFQSFGQLEHPFRFLRNQFKIRIRRNKQ